VTGLLAGAAAGRAGCTEGERWLGEGGPEELCLFKNKLFRTQYDREYWRGGGGGGGSSALCVVVVECQCAM
jgi:hypothetical protein